MTRALLSFTSLACLRAVIYIFTPSSALLLIHSMPVFTPAVWLDQVEGRTSAVDQKYVVVVGRVLCVTGLTYIAPDPPSWHLYIYGHLLEP